MAEKRNYRGKRVDNDKWVYGYFWTYDNTLPDFIREIKNGHPIDHEVHPDTVGQYTGIKDRQEIKIYEGDIRTYQGRKWIVRYGFNGYQLHRNLVNHGENADVDLGEDVSWESEHVGIEDVD